jgi:hypothetical protein
MYRRKLLLSRRKWRHIAEDRKATCQQSTSFVNKQYGVASEFRRLRECECEVKVVTFTAENSALF